MNRRDFMAGLAALSLPAVVARKVAEIAGYGTLVSVNGCDCRQCWDCLCDCIEPASYTVEISGVAPTRWITVEQACEEYALPMSHFQPITNAVVHYRPPCTGTPIG